MLNSNDRRPAFDAFFASLEDDFRAVFLDDAMVQYIGLQEAHGEVSLIDCMENVWDEWRELRYTNPSCFDPHDVQRVIMAHMLCPQREERERNYTYIGV
jgi:hypothetical protein